MSSDGLIFKIFDRILPKFRTPYAASLTAGLSIGLLATFIDLNELIDMLSIGLLIHKN